MPSDNRWKDVMFRRRRSDKVHTPPKTETKEVLEVIIEFPRGSIENRIRKLKVNSPITAGEMSEELSKKFGMSRDDRWKLFGSANESESPRKLNRNDPIDQYRSDRNPSARLYFYPEVTVR